MRGVFVPVLWDFSGQFFVVVGICPGFVALAGTFSFCGEVCPRNSAFSGTFRPAWGIFSRFGGQNKDVLLPLTVFVPVLCVSQDIFFTAAVFVPEFQRFPGHFSISMIFRAGLRPNSRSKVVYKEPPCGKQGISTPLNKHSSQKIVITKNKHLKP